MEHLSDQDLLLLIKKDDHFAFDIIFERHWQSLYQAARVRLNDHDRAKDIVQEIFITLWQRRSVLAIKGSLENYLQGAVRLSVISHFKSKKINEVQLKDALYRINMLEDSVGSLEGYLELEKALQQAVDVMPEMLKKVYQLRSENLSVKAIASELGLADQTVKNYITEVLRRLRTEIAAKFPEKHLTYIAILAMLLNK